MILGKGKEGLESSDEAEAFLVLLSLPSIPPFLDPCIPQTEWQQGIGPEQSSSGHLLKPEPSGHALFYCMCHFGLP